MIWLFLLCLVVITALLQRSWADLSLKQLTYTMTWEPALAEPEEPITLTSRLENRGWLPVMYALLSENLPAGAKVLESGEWQREHLFPHAMGTSLRSATYLLPRRSRTGSVRIALPRRGWYPLGGATLSAGDFLGLKESTAYLNHTDGVVVIPRRAETPELLQALGGFLGDLSVRRFILEDPILTTGFREYTGREPMKAISWTQSARAGQLMVKQYDHTSEVRISVLLNTEGGCGEELEQCFALTRTVCETLEIRGIPYDFRTNGELPGTAGLLTYLPQGLGRQHLTTILYSLGRAQYRSHASLEALADRCVSHSRSQQGYILITPPLTAEREPCLRRLREAAEGSLLILAGEEGAA